MECIRIRRTPKPGGRTFLWAVGLAGAGAVLFFFGVGLAFGRVGNTANYLAGLGILLLIVGGVLNLAATVQGLRFMVVRRSFLWWWPLALLLAVASLAGGWQALHL